ncbi:DNA polymerase III subunit alpha [Virgibacillus sp. W0430]|uniref:DNA polymerase III subunit alpha n=1 Tax=Virgibacillus sp. W0430 TaxID=3391580 RepID=UPI003F46619C
MSFTHLQVHSGYSLLTSTIVIDKLVQKAKNLGFHSLALTDEQVLYGAVSFYQACRKEGISPIIGMTVNVLYEKELVSCVLLAKNNTGYYDLIQLSSYIQRQEETQIEFSEIAKYTNQLKCILPICTHPYLQNLLEKQLYDQAHLYYAEWQKKFSKTDVYLGVQHHGSAWQHALNEKAKAFQLRYDDILFVALNDVRYLEERDKVAYDCLLAIKAGEQWTHNAKDELYKNRHLRSEEEMAQLFAHWPEVIEATEILANECNVELEFDKQVLPAFPVEEPMDADSYLEKLCWENANELFQPLDQQVRERLANELEVIQTMGFSDYFLIVADFVAFAKGQGIFVGPGRGSAAGSLVAYVLGITNVNPLKYGLLFERFLNSERVSLPDIDIDFSDYRRDEVINYVRDKYGVERVAQIITFGTYAARSIVRDLIKTMNINSQDAAFILKHIPIQGSKPLKEYIDMSNELKSYIKQSNELRTLFLIALTLEGIPRHISTHAAGIVITEKPLIHHVPLLKGANETYVTQFAMNDLEAIGLLKIDLLGLKNLTLLEQIIRSIQRLENRQVDLAAIPLEDEKTFHLLQLGRTNGVFQFESQGMKQVLQRLKPDGFEDLVAVNALYRPGPMDFITTYINRKHKKETVTYLHPDLEPILSKTYGVLIYQEQIMLIAHTFAGFTYGQADLLRRAVSKKQKNVMEEQRKAFINGCLNNGYRHEVAAEVFSWIMKFSDYGFNRSHAVAYSKIAYQLAYLKANFPVHFFAELLSGSINQQEKVHLYIKELRERNIVVKQPSINYSFGRFTVERDAVRIGLSLIKGIGNQVIKEIVRVRKQGLFKDLFDFCVRTSPKIVNRSAIELLIRAGAFDETYSNRASLLASLDQAMERGELFGDLHTQGSLFESMTDLEAEYVEIDDFNQTKKLTDEKELLGIYVSSHPLGIYRKQLQANGYVSIQKGRKGNRKQKAIVVVQSIKTIRTKRGDRMAFLTIGDETDEMDAVVFPEVYRKAYQLLEEGSSVEIEGSVVERNNRVQWVIDMITLFDNSRLEKESNYQLFIKILEKNSTHILQVIQQVAEIFPGNTPVIVYNQEQNKTYQLGKQYDVAADKEAITLLKKEVGTENVVLKKQTEE